MKTQIPHFRNPLDTPEGRHERAVWTLLDGERQGIQTVLVMDFLRKKGLSEAEILAALNEASGGAVAWAALGG